VFFDNLQVRQDRGRIIEENHYYAHGLKIAAISSKAYGAPNNNYGYQGDFSEMDDDLGWNDFELRSYDPQIGRFLQNDPYDQFASGYVGMGNDPVNGVDPSGGLFGGPGLLTPGGFWNGSFLSQIGSGFSFGINISANAMSWAGIAMKAISLTSQGISIGQQIGSHRASASQRPFYDSPEAAAIGWGERCNNRSINEKREYYSFIYRITLKENGLEKVYYSYTNIIIGGSKKEKGKRVSWWRIKKLFESSGMSEGGEIEYSVHSHGNDSYGNNLDEDFSQKGGKGAENGVPDSDIDTDVKLGLKGGFLTTPRGMVKVNRKEEDRTLDICNCLDNDPEVSKPRIRINKINYENFRPGKFRDKISENLKPTWLSNDQINKMIK